MTPNIVVVKKAADPTAGISRLRQALRLAVNSACC